MWFKGGSLLARERKGKLSVSTLHRWTVGGSGDGGSEKRKPGVPELPSFFFFFICSEFCHTLE